MFVALSLAAAAVASVALNPLTWKKLVRFPETEFVPFVMVAMAVVTPALPLAIVGGFVVDATKALYVDAIFCAFRRVLAASAAPVIPAMLGMAMAAMTAITAITTSNSTKLNAD